MKRKIFTICLMGIMSFSLVFPAISFADSNSDVIEAQLPTENTAVYGEELSDNIGHIDGPVEVEVLSDSTTINYNYGQGGDSSKDSYIGETTEDAAITTNDNVHKDEIINIGEGVTVNEESGTANHTPINILTDEEVNNRNQVIETVLKDIAQKGDEAIAAGEDSRITTEEDLLKEIKKINEQLKTSTESDFFVINIAGELLSDGDNYDSLNKELSGLIYNNQNKSTILINIKVPDKDCYIIASVEMNRNYQSYDPLAHLLYWNFGSYDKKIIINSEWGGVILAPLAEINLKAGIHSGRVVGDTVTTDGEIHTSVNDDPTKPKVEEPKEPEEENPPIIEEKDKEPPTEKEKVTTPEEPEKEVKKVIDKTPSNTDEKEKDTIKAINTVNTGDNSNSIISIIIFICALITLFIVAKKINKKA